MARGLGVASPDRPGARGAQGPRKCSRSTRRRAFWPARASAALRGALQSVIKAPSAKPRAILFIDEIHSTVAPAPRPAGRWIWRRSIKPIPHGRHLRVIGSTTFEDFKHIEKDRALARRLQKIPIDEPSIEENDSESSTGSAVRTRPSRRQLHGSRHRGRREARGAAPCAITSCPIAPSTSSTKRAPSRPPCAPRASARQHLERCGVPVGQARQDPSRTRQAPHPTPRAHAPRPRPSAAGHRCGRPRHRGGGRAHGPHPGAASDLVGPRAVEDPRGIARAGRLRPNGCGSPRGTVDQAIARRSRPAGIGRPDVFFTGPTGVGKTELAKQLALLLGNEFIRFDMSEYMEKHAVAAPHRRAPPGMSGSSRAANSWMPSGRILTRSCYSTKSRRRIRDIYNILLQVMDHATLTDNSGRKADFRHVVLILTSNAGSREMSTKSIGFTDDVGAGGMDDIANDRRRASRRPRSSGSSAQNSEIASMRLSRSRRSRPR